MFRNLTVRLPAETIQQARVLAARRGTSISALVAETIERLTRDEERYQAAMRQALADLERGVDLGGGPYLDRDAAHER